MLVKATVTLGLVGLCSASSSPAWANPSEPSQPLLSQVNSIPVGTFPVPPDHWAAEAVRNLVENYGCLAGYPDGTFRGDQPVTRNEFAAGMNACLDVVFGLIEQRRAANQAEVEALLQSMQEVRRDLNDLENRVSP